MRGPRLLVGVKWVIERLFQMRGAIGVAHGPVDPNRNCSGLRTPRARWGRIKPRIAFEVGGTYNSGIHAAGAGHREDRISCSFSWCAHAFPIPKGVEQ